MSDTPQMAEQMLRDKRRGRWFEHGVKFRCLAPECVACCTGSRGAGNVWVNADEMQAIATYLRMEIGEFRRQYVRRVGNRFSLLENERNDCTFLNEAGCSIYEARPTQCRTYPFWKENMKSPQAWREEAEHCPGIGEGPNLAESEIRQNLALDRNWYAGRTRAK